MALRHWEMRYSNIRILYVDNLKIGTIIDFEDLDGK